MKVRGKWERILQNIPENLYFHGWATSKQNSSQKPVVKTAFSGLYTAVSWGFPLSVFCSKYLIGRAQLYYYFFLCLFCQCHKGWAEQIVFRLAVWNQNGIKASWNVKMLTESDTQVQCKTKALQVTSVGDFQINIHIILMRRMWCLLPLRWLLRLGLGRQPCFCRKTWM